MLIASYGYVFLFCYLMRNQPVKAWPFWDLFLSGKCKSQIHDLVDKNQVIEETSKIEG